MSSLSCCAAATAPGSESGGGGGWMPMPPAVPLPRGCIHSRIIGDGRRIIGRELPPAGLASQGKLPAEQARSANLADCRFQPAQREFDCRVASNW